MNRRELALCISGVFCLFAAATAYGYRARVLVKVTVEAATKPPPDKFDQEAQDLYAEMRRRGLLKKDPEAAEMVQELIKRGVIKDLSQESTPKPRSLTPDQKAEAQDLYESLRQDKDYLNKNPKIQYLIQSAIKDGTLRDVSGGSKPPQPLHTITITDPKTGKSYDIQYQGKPPTDEELGDIFDQLVPVDKRAQSTGHDATVQGVVTPPTK